MNNFSQIEDPNSFLRPALGFSIKSQMGSPPTLVNSSQATNFTYLIKNKVLSENEISQIHSKKKFSDKISLINHYGAFLEYEKVEHPIFASNLQTIDYNFHKTTLQKCCCIFTRMMLVQRIQLLNLLKNVYD